MEIILDFFGGVRNVNRLIKTIMDCAEEQNVRVISMNTYGPSLEDVFIKLTGLDVRTKGVTAID